MLIILSSRLIYPTAYSTSPHEYLIGFQLRVLISKLLFSLCCFISVNDIAPSIHLLRPRTLRIILTLASCNQLISDLFGFTFKIYFKPNHLGFPDNSVGEESNCNAGDPGSIPGSGRSPGEGRGYPLQYSGLENSMDCIIVRGVSKSRA